MVGSRGRELILRLRRLNEEIVELQREQQWIVEQLCRYEEEEADSTGDTSTRSSVSGRQGRSGGDRVQVGDRVRIMSTDQYRHMEATVVSRRGVMFWNLKLEDGREIYKMKHKVSRVGSSE